MIIRRLLHSLASLVLLAGCASTVPVSQLEGDGALEVHLDANARAHAPGRELKFFVDIVNKSGHVVDLADLEVELQVITPPRKVQLRQDWRYRWGREMLLPPEKKLSVPIKPEPGLELPIEHLAEGTYQIVAVVNGRFSSRPYSLRNLRPDLRVRLRRT